MEQSENPSWRLVKHKKIINIYFQKFNCHIISANLVLFLILCKTHMACSRDIALQLLLQRKPVMQCHGIWGAWVFCGSPAPRSGNNRLGISQKHRGLRIVSQGL